MSKTLDVRGPSSSVTRMSSFTQSPASRPSRMNNGWSSHDGNVIRSTPIYKHVHSHEGSCARHINRQELGAVRKRAERDWAPLCR